MSLRIVFMGTPDFAVASLRKLLEAGMDVVAVITAPDKPAGRGKKIQLSPVKQFAQQAGISTILQPANLKDPDFIQTLQNLQADLQIVVAFRMLPEIVWQMPPKGTVNLHASLLPNYRGAAPINWALINGEKETGVTTFFIEKEIDTGQILFREKVPITDDMDAGTLHDRLMLVGGDLLVTTIRSIETGNITPVEQDKLESTRKSAPKIFKDNCRIDWTKTAPEVHNFVRGLSPYPAAWTELSDNSQSISLKIFRTHIETEPLHFAPGQLITDHKTYLKITLTDGIISIEELQLAGKTRMTIVDFLRGFQNLNTYHLV